MRLQREEMQSQEQRFREQAERQQSDMKALLQLLAKPSPSARIRQAAATCDFASIADPLDGALRTRFICSVNNEADLKPLFKMKADELDFTTAIQVAIQTEGAAKVAKETVYGPKSVPALAIAQKPSRQQPVLRSPPKKGSDNWAATMLPMWQFRPYRNFVQVQRGQVQFLQLTDTWRLCVARKHVQKPMPLDGSMSWKWSKQRRVATLRSQSFKCLSTSTGKRLPLNWTLLPEEISFPPASGQSWASRNFNRLSGITIGQVSIHCRSFEFYHRGQVRRCQHVILSFVSRVRNSRFESAWSGCY